MSPAPAGRRGCGRWAPGWRGGAGSCSRRARPRSTPGQSYIGELEAQVQRIVKALDGAPVLWIIPRFEELLWTGTHRHSRTGVLDMVLQGMEGAELHIAGEVDPAGYERLLRERPTVRSAFEPLRIQPATEAAARELARAVAPDAAVADEALALARHFLPGALPGSVLSLLDATRRRAGDAYGVNDVLESVAERSGMPLTMLDERERLDVDGLRRFFGARVVGQPEAVELMVERIALLKSGLTDPTRPLAVLLFVGPTGTGKTEIAKALAEYLFGSSERMIRIDLSEYQNEGSARRLLGTGEPEDASLGRLDPQAAVLGRAARRVREGRSGRLRPVPAGVRRRAIE